MISYSSSPLCSVTVSLSTIGDLSSLSFLTTGSTKRYLGGVFDSADLNSSSSSSDTIASFKRIGCFDYLVFFFVFPYFPVVASPIFPFSCSATTTGTSVVSYRSPTKFFASLESLSTCDGTTSEASASTLSLSDFAFYSSVAPSTFKCFRLFLEFFRLFWHPDPLSCC